MKTLDFQLDNQSDIKNLSKNAAFETRWVYNETIRLGKQSAVWGTFLLAGSVGIPKR